MTTRIAPWLEGLSDGWEVPSGFVPPEQVSSASHDANSLRKSTSRIPRRSLSGLPSSFRTQSSNSQGSVLKKRSPLAPVNSNDANTSFRPAMPTKLSGTRSFSGAPLAIDSEPGTVQQRSKSASPVKNQQTMEWKRRLLNNQVGYGDQTDLFGPSGLENIFAKDSNVENEQPKAKSRITWLQQNSDAPMPSSPPPWPSDVQSSQFQDRSKAMLPSVVEEEAAEQRDKSLVSNPFDLQCSQVSYSLQPETTGHSVVANGGLKRDFLEPPTHEHRRSRSCSPGSEQTQENSQETFSPVFISKHTSGNGKVDYAAVDARTVQQLQRASIFSHNQGEESTSPALSGDESFKQASGDHSTPANDDFSIQPPEISFSENLPTGSPLPDLGNNVQFRRGGYSQYGSFKERPLSPSLSNRIASERDGRDSLPSMLVPKTSQDLPTSNQAGNASTPEHEAVPATRSSPLKLFGTHDTFTNNRLLRRLSQINPDGTVSERPATPSVAHSAGVARFNARHNDLERSFGSGDLDDHSFHADITITDVADSEPSESDKSPGSDVPVPGSKVPLGFHYGASERKVSFDLDGLHTTCSNDISAEALSPGNTKDAATSGVSYNAAELPMKDHEISRQYSQGKRPPTSPFKNPTPKRRRTLHASEIDARLREASASFYAKLQESVNSRKRKDARPGMAHDVADPDVLAQRRILRPRNLSPTEPQKQQIQAEVREAAEEFVAHQSEKLEAVLEQIESSMTSDSAPSLQQQAECLASEVAAFTLNVQRPSADLGERKRSVTTQDFLNEAMMVMKLIRAKARPQSNLGSVEESVPDDAERSVLADGSGSEGSLLRVSRPPSREGSGWRPRGHGQQFDSRVVSQLRRFQEEEEERDDTDFIANSIASLQVDDDATANDNVVIVDEYANIRITGPPVDSRRPPDQDDPRMASQRSQQSTQRTQSTQVSADTLTGHTAGTNSTRKSENVGTLAFDAVAHLIGEQVGGMTFDKEKQRWVRLSKSPGKKQKSSFLELPSTVTSDDDPFQEISDLPVDEQMELRRISSPGKLAQAQLEALARHNAEAKTIEHKTEPNDDAAPVEAQVPSHETIVSRPVTRDGNPTIHHLQSSSIPSRYSVFASSQQEKVETRATSWSDEELAKMASWNKTGVQPSTTIDRNPIIPQSVRHTSLRSENEEYDSLDHYGDDDGYLDSILEVSEQDSASGAELDRSEKDSNRDSGGSPVQEINAPKLRPTTSTQMLPRSASYTARNRQISLRTQTLRNRFAADAHEESELSVVAPLPGDRVMSLSLSVSRPLSKRYQTLDIIAPQSSPGKVDSSFFFSDLPEFTVHEEDEERPSEKALALRLAQHAAAEVKDRYALAVKDLVKTLTDVQQDEPYWEDLKALVLRNRSLASIYGLQDFCTHIQDLDVSNNTLSHLHGAPVTIRKLTARSNVLSSLTPWNHLPNLQYLDISSNRLDHLDGLGSLIHLRELKADDNEIKDISGIFGLDGLLKLRLRRNNLQRVDFDGCAMQRLTELDLGDNDIVSVDHLEQLPALVKLRLDNNTLENGLNVVDSMPSLTHLSLHNCSVSTMDAAAFANLTYLGLDDNCLMDVEGINGLKRLHVLSMRRQSTPAGSRVTILSQPVEAHTIYLSGNDMHPFDLPHSMLNLQHLELASAALQSLPSDFGLNLPNLRTLNLNFNGLQDVRPLLNIQQLEHLSVCGNRIDRLRKSVATFAKFKHLSSLDVRDNPLTQRFSAPLTTTISGQTSLVTKHCERTMVDDDEDEQAAKVEKARHVLPCGALDEDNWHYARLDDDTKLRRRVFELLLANECQSLEVLNGLRFDRARPLAKDEVWERLLQLGVVRRTR